MDGFLTIAVCPPLCLKRINHSSTNQNAVELIEYDLRLVAINYLKTWFALDVTSGVPFALIELLLGSASGASSLKTLKVSRLLRFLKLTRLLRMEKIFSSLDRGE